METQNKMNQGHAIWIFGLSGAGKSTLAAALQGDLLRTMATRVLMLDGDRLRGGLCRGLGFTDMDRDENLRRAAEVARLGVESGLIVIGAFITPREEQRGFIRSIVGKSHLSFVHLATPLEVCRKRDAKGLYARADAGDLALLSGIDSRFDAPSQVDLQIDTSLRSVDDCLGSLTKFVRQRLRPSLCTVGLRKYEATE